MNIIKKIIFNLICFLLAKSLSAQETIVLNYEDRFSAPVEEAIIKTCLPKVNRLSSSCGGTIETLCANNFSEEMQQCIKVAAQLWEEKLSFPSTIVLQFEKERLGKDAPGFKVEVAYTPINSVDIYPQSLAVNLGLVNREEFTFDALITINEDYKWDFNFSDQVRSSNNFTTAMLRSIAISLGFGSSVHKNPLKEIVFGLRGHFSPFDNIVVNSQSKFLNQVPNTGRENAELVSYVTGNNVYCKYPNNSSFKLYAPSTFKDGFTLNYFDSRGDLMSYNVQEGDKILQIDDRTLDIIKQIGWKPQTDNLKIIGAGIDNTGLLRPINLINFVRNQVLPLRLIPGNMS